MRVSVCIPTANRVTYLREALALKETAVVSMLTAADYLRMGITLGPFYCWACLYFALILMPAGAVARLRVMVRSAKRPFA